MSGDSPRAVEIGQRRWRTVIQAKESLYDRRGAPRYPVSLPCVLRHGDREADGECIDLSMTGAALSAGSWAAKLTQVSLLLPFPVGEDAIGCEVVRTERILGSVVLHVRFARLPRRAARHIERLLDDSQAEFESWQRSLADRTGR